MPRFSRGFSFILLVISTCLASRADYRSRPEIHQTSTNCLRHKSPRSGDFWYLVEVFLKINGHLKELFKYNHLVANCLIFHNLQVMPKALRSLTKDGLEVKDETLRRLSPNLT